MLSINQSIITFVVAERLMNGSNEKDRKCPDMLICVNLHIWTYGNSCLADSEFAHSEEEMDIFGMI